MSSLLKTLRMDQGWSQEQLATIADLSVRTIQRIENDEVCSLETAKALAATFNCNHEIFVESVQNRKDHTDLLHEIHILRDLRERRKFFVHLTSYVLANAMMVGINLIYTPENLWFIYPLMGWGIGITSHAYKAFSPGQTDRESIAIARILAKENKKKAF